MKLERLSAIAELVSSIAIVITLAYLAVQTRQNATAMQASVRQSMLADDRDIIRIQLEYPSLFTARCLRGELTDDELIQLNSYMLEVVRTQESRWLQYQSGGIDERTWSTYREAIPSLFCSDMIRTWFRNRAARGEFDEDFVAMIEDFLAANPTMDVPSVREGLGFDPQ